MGTTVVMSYMLNTLNTLRDVFCVFSFSLVTTTLPRTLAPARCLASTTPATVAPDPHACSHELT